MRVIRLLLAAGLMLIFSTFAFAHEGNFDLDISSWDPVIEGHDDEADPTSGEFKGWAHITVTNIMDDPWGDFHFSLTGGYGGETTDVIFTGSPYVDGINDYTVNWNGNQSLDFIFDTDPVFKNDTVTFHVYTDNTASSNPWFGICMYPTPVPEPATIALLGFGGALLMRRKG